MLMTSIKPYIVPAYFNWLRENDSRVFLDVIMEVPGTHISPYPGQGAFKTATCTLSDQTQTDVTLITLNLFWEAVKDLVLTAQGFTFTCRMSGQVTSVFVPYEAVARVYCPKSGLVKEFEVHLPDAAKGSNEPMSHEQQPESVAATEHVKHTVVLQAVPGQGKTHPAIDGVAPKRQRPNLTLVK